jgi:hypothetical protein
MREYLPGSDRNQIPFRSLIPFLLITFGLTWAILGLFIVFPDKVTGIFGELTGQHPLFFLAVYAPAIAALIIVTSNGGTGGFRRYLHRFLLWRCSPWWYIFLILGIPLLFIGGSALKGNLLTEPLPFSSVRSLIVAFALMAIKGPVEEFGWRGVLLPLLQRKLAPIWASLVVGAIWGLWHLPAFMLSGTEQGSWSFTPFFIGSIALSVIVTPLFNQSNGSILLPALFHYLVNNPIFPNAQPYDIYLFAIVAGLIVWLNRKTMFVKKNAVTQVIPFAVDRHDLKPRT